MNFLSPYLTLIKIGALVLAALTLFGLGYKVSSDRWEKKYIAQAVEAQNQLNKVRDSYNVAIDKANEKAREKSDVLKTAIAELTTTLKVKNEEIDKTKKDLLAKAKIFTSSSGAISGGLRFAGTGCAKPEPGSPEGLQASRDPEVKPRAGNEAQCRLDEKVSGTLIALVTEGDAAITQLNLVIDAYNKVQTQGCGPTTQAEPAKSTGISAPAEPQLVAETGLESIEDAKLR
jgi:hypothetical protein